MSITFCEFTQLTFSDLIRRMFTAAETRRMKLEMLLKRYRSIAELNEALGWTRTDPKLSQIRNANTRPDRQKPYQMGDAMAREIENALLLERGWMDTPPTLSEQYGHQDTKAMVMEVMDKLPQEHHATVLRLVNALVQPADKNGTSG